MHFLYEFIAMQITIYIYICFVYWNSNAVNFMLYIDFFYINLSRDNFILDIYLHTLAI